jgi:hypothetical protein
MLHPSPGEWRLERLYIRMWIGSIVFKCLISMF